MTKKILITGGAGFVGSRLIKELVKLEKVEVYSLDNYFTGVKENHVGGAIYIEGDCRDITTHIDFSPDVVYHFGEYSRVSTSFDDNELVWQYNVLGTRAVVEFCKEKKSKLIYSASSTKFGDGGKNKNCSPYAFHKAQNTELINNYGEWFGLEYVICYFYNVYGAGQISEGKYATVIGIFEKQYLAKEPQSIVFPGTQARNFTHISDVVSALILLKGPSKGDGYCIGTEKSHMIVEVAKMFSEDVVYLGERHGERYTTSIDLAKMNELGWTAEVELEKYIAGIKENNK
jgi:UDP-glucose 4-epimerase